MHESPQISAEDLARKSRVQTKASVIPKPARKMGANPIRGLILVPLNGATGVSYSRYMLDIVKSLKVSYTLEVFFP